MAATKLMLENTYNHQMVGEVQGSIEGPPTLLQNVGAIH
jgi:hypothetical protein